MAAGRPVIAYDRGGARDTVIEGLSGTLFAEQTVESLTETLASFSPDDYDPLTIRRQAQRFDKQVFRQEMKDYVLKAYEEHKKWS
jgi:glycosyltransferase involved in cell wall biosynthesis